MRTPLLISAALLLFTTVGKSETAPPSADTAQQVLSSSTRHGEWVDIVLSDGVKLKTWVVYPERADKAPVVIVIHEIFGMSDWIRSVTDQLAANGFIALAPDLLSGHGENGGGTESFKGQGVGEAIRKITPDEYTARLNATRDYAIALPAASDKSAVIGFCWGGAAAFEYATRQPNLNAALVYYGGPPKDAKALAKISASVFGFYGGDDARITSTVEKTTNDMKEANKPFTPVVFKGAGHGFLRQQSGREANEAAAKEAWKLTIEHLKLTLDKPTP